MSGIPNVYGVKVYLLVFTWLDALFPSQVQVGAWHNGDAGEQRCDQLSARFYLVFDGNITSANFDKNISTANFDRNITSANFERNITGANFERNITSANFDRNVTALVQILLCMTCSPSFYVWTFIMVELQVCLLTVELLSLPAWHR